MNAALTTPIGNRENRDRAALCLAPPRRGGEEEVVAIEVSAAAASNQHQDDEISGPPQLIRKNLFQEDFVGLPVFN